MTPPIKEGEPALQGYLKSWSFGELFYWLAIPPALLGVFGFFLVLYALATNGQGSRPPASTGDIMLGAAVLGLLVALFATLTYGVHRRARWAFKGLLAVNVFTLAGFPLLVIQRLGGLPADLAWYKTAGVFVILIVLPALGIADETLALYRALRDPRWPHKR